MRPRPQLVGWSDVFNQAVAAQSPPVPPTNEVINTYFVSSAIDSSSSGSGEKNPTLCEQVTVIRPLVLSVFYGQMLSKEEFGFL